MPIYPPRNTPIRKVEIFNKRVRDLLKSIGRNDAIDKQKSLADKVLSARINLIDARLKLLETYKEEDLTKSKMDLIEK